MRRFNDSVDGMLGRSSTLQPSVEVFQRGDEFVVRADLPGLRRDDVTVEITEDVLTIEGERREERQDRQEGYYRSERSYGSFYRTIPLPEGAISESARADFKDGVLEVIVQAPPHEVSRGRRIEIGRGEPSQGGGHEGRERRVRALIVRFEGSGSPEP